MSIESGGGGPETAHALLTKHRLHPAGGSSLKGPYATGFPVLGSGHKGLYGSLKSGSQVGKMILEIIIENTSTIREGQITSRTQMKEGVKEHRQGKGNGERKESEKKSQSKFSNILNYLKMKTQLIQNLWSTAKTVPRGKFIALNA